MAVAKVEQGATSSVRPLDCMMKLLEKAREGYYFLQLKINDRQTADFQLNFIFKYTLFLYYIDAIILLMGLFIKRQPISIQSRFILILFLGTILMGSYKLIVDWLLKDILHKPVDQDQPRALINQKIWLFLGVFFLSIGLMALLLAVYNHL